MADCFRKEKCLSYPEQCRACAAMSDVQIHYPLFKDKDLVEVVRCKDCEFYDVFGLKCLHPRHIIYMGIDDFCSHGER